MAKWDYDGPILEIENLSISFFTRLREIPAVMDFSCTVQPGEAMSLLGDGRQVGRDLTDLGRGEGGPLTEAGGVVERHAQDTNLRSGLVAGQPAPESAVGGIGILEGRSGHSVPILSRFGRRTR